MNQPNKKIGGIGISENTVTGRRLLLELHLSKFEAVAALLALKCRKEMDFEGISGGMPFDLIREFFSFSRGGEEGQFGYFPASENGLMQDLHLIWKKKEEGGPEDASFLPLAEIIDREKIASMEEIFGRLDSFPVEGGCRYVTEESMDFWFCVLIENCGTDIFFRRVVWKNYAVWIHWHREEKKSDAPIC